MESETTHLVIEVTADAADTEELAQMTDELQQELLELDVEAVQQPFGEKLPENAKAGELLAFGSIAVTLGPAIIESIVSVITHWVGQRGHRQVKLVIGKDILEVSGLSSRDQRRLIDEWLQRNADR